MNRYYDFRLLVIDDNSAIHYDFIKTLSPTAPGDLDDLNEKLFNKKRKDSLLPNFKIDTATQGDEGLELIRQALNEGSRYTLAFVDIRMPVGIDGIQTIKEIWQLDPDIQVVICTAFSDYSWEDTIKSLGQTDNLIIIKKPFDSITIRQLACALAKKWQLMQETKRHMLSLEHRIQESTHSLQQSISLARATMDSSADGIVVADNQGKVVELNSKFLLMWGLKKGNILRSDIFSILNKISKESQDSPRFMKKVKEISEHNESINIDVIKLKDGRAFEFYSQPQKMADKTVGRVWSFRDISQRINLEEKLQHSATHDYLTGLPNSMTLKNKLQKSISVARINTTLFALLYVDCDHFKLINDVFGHEIGDKVLNVIAERLRISIRACDGLIKMNGDEFVILINEIASKEYIGDIARKILEIINKPIIFNQREFIVTASIGASIYPKDTKNIELLLNYASGAVGFAKKAGGNQVKFYNKKMNEDGVKLFEQETELRRAIINNEFVLFYQPQIDMRTNQLVAVEALIRWNHPEKGLIFPVDFLPLAEHTGLIIPIGEWILRTACRQVKAWQDRGFPSIRVAVNINGAQITQYDFVKTVVGILEQENLNPEFLEIEVTENMIINNPDVVGIINALKETGVFIALDDFGTGYSSLNQLRKIAVDRLKIDSSFIQNIQLNQQDEAIIKSIIDIANNMKLEVLAEGVESKEQLEFLKSQKIGQIQGFYFSHALTSVELEKLFREKKDISKLTSLLE